MSALHTQGSPPLARDKYAKALEGVTDEGITPACAGQIEFILDKINNERDHPRLRGTNNDYFKYLLSCLGSPPLARDK